MSKKILKNYKKISIEPKNLPETLNFSEIFGRSGPVHFEIGSGKGTFIVEQAKAYPEIDFFGVEWANKFYKYAVDRAGRWGLENVRLIRTDVAWLLGEHVGDETVDFFHVYFPDPWPKKRHNKRRFINDGNFAELLRCLKSGGRIQIATDHADYFEQISEVLDRQLIAGNIVRAEFIRAAGANEGEIVGTNYERKYLIEGRDVYTAAAVKVCPPAGKDKVVND